MKTYYGYYAAPFAVVGFVGSAEGLIHLGFYRDPEEFVEEVRVRFGEIPQNIDEFRDLTELLERYFSGRRTELDYPIILNGTEFQLRTWMKVREIPYGEVRSYEWVARNIGRRGAARAVGSALRRNPVALIIPCHRVVRKNGGIGGFRYGVEIKRRLLRIEGIRLRSFQDLSGLHIP